MKKTIQSITNLIAGFAMVLNVVSCAPENADLTGYMPPAPPPPPPGPPPAKPEAPWETVALPANLQGPGKTMLDILFVVDTSSSMCSDQTRLKENISKFVDEFVLNQKIDFHIGVVATWDSIKYGRNRQFKNGDLRPVVGHESGQRYISLETPNYVQALKDTVPLPYERYSLDDPGGGDPNTTGPAYEEIFSPVKAALSEAHAAGVNKGFRRKGAHLALIMFTDTDDRSPRLPVESFEEFLNAHMASNGGNLITLAALARYNEYKLELPEFQLPFPQPEGGSNVCTDEDTVDPDLVFAKSGPKLISKFIDDTGGSAFDLNKDKLDFGEKMVKFARFIVRKTISYDIKLAEPFEASKSSEIVVSINGRTLQKDSANGFSAYKGQSGAPDVIRIHRGATSEDETTFDVLITYTKEKKKE